MVSSQRLVGGMSSLILRCDLADDRSVVVRQIEDEEWLKREPTLIAQEATALRLLEQGPLRAPRLIASDIDAGRLIMSFLPGAMYTTVAQLSAPGQAESMAATAAAIAATPLPENHPLPAFRPWIPDDPQPPSWGDHGLWSAAIDFYHARVAELEINRLGWILDCAQPVLLHRDLHPLNMLWSGSHTSMPAVVDWLNACVGHPHAELGHCRWNLTVLAGIESADRFLQHYLQLASAPPTPTYDSQTYDSQTYDSLWDVVAVLDVGSSDGVLEGVGWQAVGREDLTGPIIAAASDAILRAALE